MKTLAERAIAAGAPEADDNTVIVIPGVSFRSIATGLVYDRATRLPLLSDWSWLGWVQGEVERRGWTYSLESTAGEYYLTVFREEVTHGGLRMDRPALLVKMLEATR